MRFSQVLGLGAAAILNLAAGLSIAQTPYGVHPRARATDYAASQQTASGIFAASLVPRDEVKRLFAVDISGTYVVLEVAVYPAANSGPAQLAADDFVVRAGASGSEFTHPADPVTVASVIQEKNTPRPSRNSSEVVTSAGVGYASGTDPYTGRHVHGVYTEAGAGVATGVPDSPAPPRPGSSDFDRMTLQQQLTQRALPDGSFTAPVAGFLYFPAKEIKKKDGTYDLEYLAAAGTVHVRVPVKTR